VTAIRWIRPGLRPSFGGDARRVHLVGFLRAPQQFLVEALPYPRLLPIAQPPAGHARASAHKGIAHERIAHASSLSLVLMCALKRLEGYDDDIGSS
jgi:hypothetical protein